MRAASCLALAALGAGCEDEQRRPISAPRERSQAIQSTATAVPSPSSASAASAPRAASAAKKRAGLCSTRTRDGRALPKKRLSQAAVNEAEKLPESVLSSGGYTWVNFWAAWCAPCKEEIPRLVRWQRELTNRRLKFHVAFVSIDDDERQLHQFLEGSSELRATYWLKEGKERDEWMSGAGLESDPELPIHLLLGPDGRIQCKIEGAVEDADFADLLRLVGGS